MPGHSEAPPRPLHRLHPTTGSPLASSDNFNQPHLPEQGQTRTPNFSVCFIPEPLVMPALAHADVYPLRIPIPMCLRLRESRYSIASLYDLGRTCRDSGSAELKVKLKRTF